MGLRFAHRCLARFFALAIGWALAGSAPAVEISVTDAPHSLSPALLEAWKEELVTEEVIRFTRFEWLEEFLLAQVDDAKLRERLRANSFRNGGMSREISERVLRAGNLFHEGDSSAGILLDPQLRSELPPTVLHAFYSEQARTTASRPLWGRFRHWEALDDFLETHVPSLDDRVRLKFGVIRVGGWLELPVTPDTWRWFSDSARTDLIFRWIGTASGTGLQVRMRISKSDDLMAIALGYSGNRDPRPLERYLRLRLGTAESVVVSLNDILPSYIRKNTDRFSTCEGPNCFNAGLNVNRRRPEVVHTHPLKMRDELLEKYRPVRREESLRTQDLLVYADMDGKALHATSYIDPDFAFTKNGASRFRQNVIQRHSTIEKVYFPEGEFKLKAFRIAGPGEPTIGASGGDLGEFYFQGRVPKEFGITAQMSRPEVDRQVEKTVSEFLSNPVFYWRLDKMIESPLFLRFRTELEGVREHLRPFAPYEDLARTIGFNPIGSAEKNVEALAALIEDRKYRTYRQTQGFLTLLRDLDRPEHREQLAQIERIYGLDFSKRNGARDKSTACVKLITGVP